MRYLLAVEPLYSPARQLSPDRAESHLTGRSKASLADGRLAGSLTVRAATNSLAMQYCVRSINSLKATVHTLRGQGRPVALRVCQLTFQSGFDEADGIRAVAPRRAACEHRIDEDANAEQVTFAIIALLLVYSAG